MKLTRRYGHGHAFSLGNVHVQTVNGHRNGHDVHFNEPEVHESIESILHEAGYEFTQRAYQKFCEGVFSETELEAIYETLRAWTKDTKKLIESLDS